MNDAQNVVSQHTTHVGSLLATNRTLRVVIAILLFVVLVIGTHDLYNTILRPPMLPLVIGVNNKGVPIVTSYDEAKFTPNAQAIRTALMRFVDLHESRVRRTLDKTWTDSWLFLDESVRRDEEQTHGGDPVLAFQMDLAKDEIEIEPGNVVLDQFDVQPFTATIDYQKKYVSPGQLRERKREDWKAKVQFTVLPETQPHMRYVNPSGVVITRLETFAAYTNQ